MASHNRPGAKPAAQRGPTAGHQYLQTQFLRVALHPQLFTELTWQLTELTAHNLRQYTAASESPRRGPLQGGWCAGSVEAPYFISTKNNKMYATAKITSCSSPKPTSCNLGVELYTTSITTPVLESAWTNWGACKNRTLNTPGYPCVISPGEHSFYTQGTLEIQSPAGGDTGYAVSNNSHYYCTV
jgi:hypothetical protein